VAGPADALTWLATNRCDLVLQDMNFSRRTTGEEGMELLAQVRAAHPHLPVVLITAWGSIDLAVRGMKAGASDFIVKPWANEQILQTVRTALGLSAAPPPSGQAPSREELDAAFDFGHLVGEDPRLRKVLQVIGRVAPTDASVLIMGESGTGKELIADAIHRNSRRRGRPFVKVNLGGISSTLFESEMFGHVRGAFTDARQDREGRFSMADGGTIFLDEIGDLDQSVAGQAAARAAGPDLRGARLEPEADRRRAGRLGYQPEPGRDGGPRRVPRGPAVSHQPDRVDAARAARSAG
jgi:DNA-binding NtrC family response regulator